MAKARRSAPVGARPRPTSRHNLKARTPGLPCLPALDASHFSCVRDDGALFVDGQGAVAKVFGTLIISEREPGRPARTAGYVIPRGRGPPPPSAGCHCSPSI
jgi:hypothetical protein